MTGESYFSWSAHVPDVTLQIDHGRILTVVGILAFLVMAYSLLVVQQILLGVVAVLAMVMVYLFFVFIQILDRIATALEGLVEQRRRE